MNADGQKQAVKCSMADGYVVRTLPERILQLCDSHTLNSVSEVQRQEVRAGPHDVNTLLSKKKKKKKGFLLLGHFG